MRIHKGSIWVRLLGAVVAGVAALVFGATLSRYVYPGTSADLLAQHGGLFFLRSPDHPLWGLLFEQMTRLPLGSWITRISWLSAVFGVVAVVLLYHVMTALLSRIANPTDLTGRQARVLACVGGSVAALALCFSSPFWIVATRPYNATFDIALFLGAMALLLSYAGSRATLRLYLLAFVWGLGTVEYATFIIFTPLFVLTLALLMWQEGHLRPLPIGVTALCGVLGLSLYLVTAWSFYGSDGYLIKDYPNFFRIIWFMWRDQYRLIALSLPREGWLLILLTTGIPWLIGSGMSRRGMNDEPRWSDYALHLILSAICGLVLLNGAIAPWALLGHARLLVMPYVLTAALTGYLAAYWLRQLMAWGARSANGLLRGLMRASGVAVGVLLIGATAAAPFRNYRAVDSKPAAVLEECAAIVRDAASGDGGTSSRVWVVSDGMMDNLLRVVAHRRKRDLSVLDLRNDNNEGYRRYVATLFDAPRLKNLARIGLTPLLRELMQRDGNSIANRTVVFGLQGPWTMLDRIAIPDRLVTRGVRSIDDVDLMSVYAQHQRFWARIGPRLQAIRRSTAVADPVAHLARRLLQQASLMANNLGVLLEDAAREPEAFAAYREARKLLPGNISTLLNMNRMLDQGFESEREEALRAELAALKESDQRFDIMLLSSAYGFVREPEAFSGIARIWALTGQPRMATESLQRALDLVGVDREKMLKADLAGLYLEQSRDEESEALYYELLVENPEDRQALMGLARIEARKGNFKEADALLTRARKAGGAADAIALERAIYLLERGDNQAARDLLEPLLREEEERIPVWTLFCSALTRLGDWDALERAAERLRYVSGGAGLVSEVEGTLAIRNANLRAARRHFADALNEQPGRVRLLDIAMRVDLVMGQYPAAVKGARAILQLDRSHALANYVIGASRLSDGEIDLAEDALRQSLARKRLPQALNDLAWLLVRKQEYDEAEKLAREAVAVLPGMYQAWDTLGEIRLKQDRLAAAEAALQKALALGQDRMGVLLHMAQLQAAKGDTPQAREIMAMIADKTGRLSSTAKAEYDRLQRDLE